MAKVFHTLEPVFDENSKVLILGSFPSPKSRETGFYYGHPQNRFWRVLAAVFDEAVPTTNEEKKAFVLRHRIALWDVCASCEIEGAADSSIQNVTPNDFSVIRSVANVRAVFTTGKTANALYERFTGEKALLLPSPSPANCAVPFSTLVARYAVVKTFL